MKQVTRWMMRLIVLTVACVAPTVLAAGPAGAGPNDALPVADGRLTLPAQTQVWHYFDYTGNKSRVLVFLDDGGAAGVEMGIYTPDLAHAWLSDRTLAPVGRGSKPASGAAAVHDSIWQGAFQIHGRYYASLTNTGSAPVQYRLTIQGDDVALGPTRTPTPGVTLVNPHATPVPQGTLSGKVLFQDASGGEIYIVNGDGTDLKRVTSGLDPAMSPDGTRIAFVRWTAPMGLYVADADGTHEQLVFGGTQVTSPQWSPDGTRLAFSRPNGGNPEDKVWCFYRDLCYTFVADPHYKIGVLDLSTLALTEPKCSNHCVSPTWNADNHTLAYADATFGILATDTMPNGGPQYDLYTDNPKVQSPRYSPDGDKLAFQARRGSEWNILVMDAAGGGVTAVTRGDPQGFVTFDSVAPAWSPDGKQMLYLANRSGKWEFYAANADGTNVRQVLKRVTDAISLSYDFTNERMVSWLP